MSIFDSANCGAFGSLLGGTNFGPFGFPWGATYHPQSLAAMQQQQVGFDPFAFQRQQAQGMQAMMSYPPEPQRKKVESRIIETVEIRPEQDVKLLKAGTKL